MYLKNKRRGSLKEIDEESVIENNSALQLCNFDPKGTIISDARASSENSPVNCETTMENQSSARTKSIKTKNQDSDASKIVSLKTENETESMKDRNLESSKFLSFYKDYETEKNKQKQENEEIAKRKAQLNVWDDLTKISLSNGGGLMNKKIEELYLKYVIDGAFENVEILLDFEAAKEYFHFEFDRNCLDDTNNSALSIAIKNKDIEMCKILLANNVSIGDGLFHAIEENYAEGVNLLLKHSKPCNDTQYLHCDLANGSSPVILAARKNNYAILKLLFQNQYEEVKKPLKKEKAIKSTCDLKQNKKLSWSALSSPAYITLMIEKNGNNVFDYCMSLIEDLKQQGKIDSELREFCKEQSHKVEAFMCDLLDKVQSDDELKIVFEQSKSDNSHDQECDTQNLDILNKACKLKLYDFVAHDNTRLALFYHYYRYTPELMNRRAYIRFVYQFFYGLLFFLWSLAYTFAPRSQFGRKMMHPAVAYPCHLVSRLMLLGFLLVNPLAKPEEWKYLGALPTVIEWIIAVWVFGKWVEELIEWYRREFHYYLKDWWNLSDIACLIFFTGFFILRVIDYIKHKDDETKVYIPNWPSYEPRVISTAFLSCFYIMAFLNFLDLTRSNRLLASLCLTLARMFKDALRFFGIFLLVWFAFAIGLNELFWFYGSGQESLEGNVFADCKQTYFLNLINSLTSLFWMLFGYFDPEKVVNCSQSQKELGQLGMILLAVYHFTMVLILLNMLIAMMSKSFETTSRNEETVYRFHKAVIWIRYIRGNFTRPSPFVLIPGYDFFQIIKNRCEKLSEVPPERIEMESKQLNNSNNSLSNKLIQRYIHHKFIKKPTQESSNNFQSKNQQRKLHSFELKTKFAFG